MTSPSERAATELRTRIALYSTNPATVLAREVDNEIAAVQANTSPQDQATQNALIGHLFALRAHHLGETDAAHRERAMSYLFLVAVAHVPDTIPSEMAALVGPSADPREQLNAGADFLKASQGDTNCLKACVHILTTAISQLPMDEQLADPMSWISAAYMLLHNTTHDLATVDEQLRFSEGAVAVAAIGSEKRVQLTANFVNGLSHRFTHRKDQADLDRAIAVAQNVLATTEPHLGERARLLSSLADVYQERAAATNSTADLDHAMTCSHAAIEFSSDEDHFYAGRVFALSRNHWQRYLQSSRTEDLDQAIGYAEAALHNSPSQETMVAALSNLAQYYKVQFDSTADPDALNRSILHLELGAPAVPPGTIHCVRVHGNLATLLLDRLTLTGNLADADRAIEHAAAAYRNCPPTTFEAEQYLSRLALAYRRRFDLTSRRDDIDQCVSLTEKLLDITTELSARADHESTLAFALSKRFGQFDDRVDIDRAVEINRRLSDNARHDAEKATHLLHLSNMLRERFYRSDDPKDMDDSIAAALRAVALAPAGEIRTTAIGGLAGCYGSRFQRRGDRGDLDLAIDHSEQQLRELEVSHPSYTTATANLGRSLRHRHTLDGAATDLDRAIETFEYASTDRAQGRIVRHDYTAQLANCLLTRSQRHDGVPGDLDRAIELLRKVVAETTPEDLTAAVRLDDLANKLAHRFSQRSSAERADIDEAIELQTRAMSLHVGRDRSAMMNNLAHSHFIRYQQLEDHSDLDRALAIAETTIAGEKNPCGSVSLLARLYRNRIDAGGPPPSAAHYQNLVDRAQPRDSDSPDTRLSKARQVGLLAATLDDLHTAVRLMDIAISELPQTMSRQITMADQEDRIAEYEGLITEAIETFCLAGDLTNAVRIAEQGRCIAVGRSIDLLDDVSALTRSHPDLADRLTALHTALAATDADLAQPGFDTVAHRAQLWREHDQLVELIQKSGYPEFAKPPSVNKLIEGLPGPVIIVVAGRLGGHAIIISPSHPPQHVALPALTYEHARRHAITLALTDLTSSTDRPGEQLRTALDEILPWLWKCAAEPLIQHLGWPTDPADGTRLPRVWWMPVGVMSLLPLHAATPGTGGGVLDTMISSYTPTLRALLHAHTRPSLRRRQVLAVQVASAPGLPPLPATAAEGEWLRQIFPAAVVLADEQATRSAVVSTLPHTTWVHLSCHATADLLLPSRSGAHLFDGLLSLLEVSRLRLPDAELAFLSACSTGRHGIRQADEAFTLGTAFHLAGFRHVISSQWPLSDRVAATVAHDFYTTMALSPTASTTAATLHATVRRLRSRLPGRPDLWAPFVHSGP